jgi:ParB family chromosome partitioning protein
MENIDDPKHAMRSELDRESLFQLADNIKQNGLINPITVRPIEIQNREGVEHRIALLAGDTAGPNIRYEVVAGHRRFSACKIAGKSKIACVVRYLTDKEVFAIMTAENLERADVDPVDEAIHLHRHIELTGESIIEVAKSIRRSVGYVESRLEIGSMPDYMKAYIKSGQLKLGAALALFQITNDVRRRVWVDMAVRDGVSVAQAEYWVYGWKMNQLPGGSDDEQPPEGFEPSDVSTMQFECALDGKKYDVRMFKTAMIYEGNYPLFMEIAKHMREDVPPVQVADEV